MNRSDALGVDRAASKAFSTATLFDVHPRPVQAQRDVRHGIAAGQPTSKIGRTSEQGLGRSLPTPRQYVAPEHMWMGMWGLLQKPPSQFLGGRKLHPLHGTIRDLQVPLQIQRQSYNPSIAWLPQAVREELGCRSCTYAASARVDWMTQCHGFTRLLKYRQQLASSTRFGPRKATLIMLLDPDWQPLYWGWLKWNKRIPALSLIHI